eukprot:523748-Prymnesium_polylepis.3
MKVIGNVIRVLAEELGQHVPLIGVVPFGAIHHAEKLVDQHGQDALDVVYPSEPIAKSSFSLLATHQLATNSGATNSGAPLNPDHSHFLLVDDGTRGSESWGCEIGFRAALTDYFVRDRHVPVVQLVVRGGPGTLRTVLNQPDHVPSIVFATSGGIAENIYEYILAVDEEEPRAEEVERSSRKSVSTGYVPKATSSDRGIRNAVCETHQRCPMKFWFFDPGAAAVIAEEVWPKNLPNVRSLAHGCYHRLQPAECMLCHALPCFAMLCHALPRVHM